jgi:hypothetical protein
LLGCGSLPEREWDHANGYKQNQVTGASKKMGSNHGVNTLFHFDRAPAKQTTFYRQRVKNVKTSLRMETAGRPNSANGNKNGGRFGESSNEKEISHGKVSWQTLWCDSVMGPLASAIG